MEDGKDRPTGGRSFPTALVMTGPSGVRSLLPAVAEGGRNYRPQRKEDPGYHLCAAEQAFTAGRQTIGTDDRTLSPFAVERAAQEQLGIRRAALVKPNGRCLLSVEPEPSGQTAASC